MYRSSKALQGQETYRHSSIKAREFRLLQIEQSDGSPSQDVLRGTLETKPIDHPGSFDALSYVCGLRTPERPEYILIDAQTIPITKNCQEALRHLRDHIGVKTVWVDAICIDQSGGRDADMEKSSQIKLMTEIYGKARRVYIWLGPSSGIHGSDLALEWLRNVSLWKQPLTAIRYKDWDRRPWAQLPKLARIIPDVFRAGMQQLQIAYRIPNYDPDAMRDIIRREWFQRMWTIQEAVMAEEPWVLCGRQVIRLHHLGWGLISAAQRADDDLKSEFAAVLDSINGIFLLWSQLSVRAAFRGNQWTWVDSRSPFFHAWQYCLRFLEKQSLKCGLLLLTAYATIVALRYYRGLKPFASIPLVVITVLFIAIVYATPSKDRRKLDNKSRRIFVFVLNTCRNHRSTLPKDKVFALYGVLQELDVVLPTPKYEPTYSLERAYFEFTLSLIAWDGTLEVLLEASGPWSSQAPSWIPDWSKSFKRPALLPNSRATDQSSPMADPSGSFEITENGMLIVQVAAIGEVVLCASLLESPLVEEVDNIKCLSDMPAILQCLRHIDSLSDMPAILQHFRHVDRLRQWLRAVMGTRSMTQHKVGVFLHAIGIWSNIFKASDFCGWVETIMSTGAGTPIEVEDGIFTIMSIPLESGRRITRSLSTQDEPRCNQIWATLLKLAQTKKSWALHQAVLSALASKTSIFIAKYNSTNSHILGAGPHSVRNNDLIMLLPTPNVPMILRARPWSQRVYELMGPVFAGLTDVQEPSQYESRRWITIV